jgi:hypothetical protein
MYDVTRKRLLRDELWKFIEWELHAESTFDMLMNVSGGIFVGVFGPVKTHLMLMSSHTDGKLAGSTHASILNCNCMDFTLKNVYK